MPNLRPREYGTVASFSSPSPGASTSPSLLSLRRVNELGLLSAVHLGAPCEPLFTLQVTGDRDAAHLLFFVVEKHCSFIIVTIFVIFI